MADTLQARSTEAGHMSLMEHLVELRNRLIKCAIAIAIGAAIGWALYHPVFEILRGPLDDLAGAKNVSARLQVLNPLDGFLLRIKMSTYIGLAIAMPYLLYQLWKFISPGLYQNERRYASAFVASATFLFLLGAAIAFFTLPQALKFLQAVGGKDLYYQYSPESYLMLIIYMMLAFGLGFEFPILLVALQLVGVLTPKMLSDFRRFGIVIIFVVAAVITPSADPVSLFALAIPMMIFYEISILVGRLVKRRRAKADAAA